MYSCGHEVHEAHLVALEFIKSLTVLHPYAIRNGFYRAFLRFGSYYIIIGLVKHGDGVIGQICDIIFQCDEVVFSGQRDAVRKGIESCQRMFRCCVLIRRECSQKYRQIRFILCIADRIQLIFRVIVAAPEFQQFLRIQRAFCLFCIDGIAFTVAENIDTVQCHIVGTHQRQDLSAVLFINLAFNDRCFTVHPERFFIDLRIIL